MSTAFKISATSIDFNGAISYCKSTYNSSLATIFTSQQNGMVSELCSSQQNSKSYINCWIGLHKNDNNNNWYWTQNNMTTNFTQWSNISHSNSKHCVEMTANVRYNGEWNKISCSKLKYPICNDPSISNDSLRSTLIAFNHNRKVLQHKKISCTEYNTDTCIIHQNSTWNGEDIECDPNFPNCNITVHHVLYSNIHCPRNDCDSCIIYCGGYVVRETQIKGYNCNYLTIVVNVSFVFNVIEAPRNGGTLEIIPIAPVISNSFISSTGTADITVFVNGNGSFENNNIMGGNLTGNLTFDCIENAYCYDNEIICGVDNTGCYINCSSAYYKGGCHRLTVDVCGRTSDIDWYCDNSQESECLNAKLISRSNYSECVCQSTRMQYVNGKWQLENNNNDCVDISTTIPTISPSPSPTIQSTAPSEAPTEKQTVFSEEKQTAPLDMEQQRFFFEEKQLVTISGVVLFIFIVIICGLVYYYQIYKPQKKSLYVKNALVILIGISEYDDDEVENDEIGGVLDDLFGINHDITNMVNLFHDNLNYDVYPSEYLDAISKGCSPKQYWTEQELNEFLVDRAKYLEKNIEKYDGLMVIISGHGIPGNICTSDYKKFSKLAIHRIFSAAHPKSREIPRLFLFDCCSGGKKREIRRYSTVCDDEKNEKEGPKDEVNETTKYKKDTAKQIAANNVDGDGDFDRPWVEGEHNPDYRLALIEAANPGFQSKLRTDIGSYVIHSFYKKTMHILKSNKTTYIHQIFDEIQNELHSKGKQHPTCTWNDNTRYIRFKKGNIGSMNEIEMMHLGKTESDKQEELHLHPLYTATSFVSEEEEEKDAMLNSIFRKKTVEIEENQNERTDRMDVI